jgi:hypothetical protein
MIDANFVTEQKLLNSLPCPLRSDGSSGQEVPVLRSAESTTRWLISEIAAGRRPTANETREYYDQRWQETRCFQSRDEMPRIQYERLLVEGCRVCRRLRDIIWRCEILQPVSRYELPISGTVITGEYAVLRSSRRKRHAFALYLRYGGLKIRPVIPDVISFVRAVDVTNRLATRDWGVDSVGVMSYWVAQDFAAEHQPDRDFALMVVLGAARFISELPFPILGPHCRSCSTRNCLPQDRDDR